MTAKPTQAEIDKVRRWERERQEQASAKARETVKQKREATLAALAESLVGRMIVAAAGEPDAPGGGRAVDCDWTELALTLDNGVVFKVEPCRWSEERLMELSLEPQ